MRKRNAKKREEVKTRETLSKVADTFLNIINDNIHAFNGEQQILIENKCDNKIHNIREIADFLNGTFKRLL